MTQNSHDIIQFINGNQIVNLYDAAGQKYKSVVYTNLVSTGPYYDVAHYSFETDTVWYNITEYAGNIQNRYSRTDTTRHIFNTIGYYTDNTYYHYIKDHIGNICAVVNSAQDTAVQSTLYYASGVPLARSFGRDVQPYLYNGKEFVEAHGLNEYDSQARMYYAPIMRTTTMDPLAEKYYHISPYAWCANNPIMYVDPDGKDELEIQWNASKEIFKVKEIKNENYDQVHIVDAEGNRITSSNQYPYGIINNPRWGNYGDRKIFLFDIAGDENASSLFEFLGKYFTIDNNMPLEWSKVQVGYKNSGRNIIGTSMKKDATGVGHYILNWGYTIRGVDHNHPKGLPPSQKDKNNATLYHSKFPNATLRVFTGKEYLQYSGQSFVLPEFIVTPK